MWASGGWEERLTSDNALLLLLLALLAACEGGEGGSSSWLCSTALVPSEPPRLNRNEFKAPCSCTHAGMARPDVSKGRAGKRQRARSDCLFAGALTEARTAAACCGSGGLNMLGRVGALEVRTDCSQSVGFGYLTPHLLKCVARSEERLSCSCPSLNCYAILF